MKKKLTFVNDSVTKTKEDFLFRNQELQPTQRTDGAFYITSCNISS